MGNRNDDGDDRAPTNTERFACKQCAHVRKTCVRHVGDPRSHTPYLVLSCTCSQCDCCARYSFVCVCVTSKYEKHLRLCLCFNFDSILRLSYGLSTKFLFVFFIPSYILSVVVGVPCVCSVCSIFSLFFTHRNLNTKSEKDDVWKRENVFRSTKSHAAILSSGWNEHSVFAVNRFGVVSCDVFFLAAKGQEWEMARSFYMICMYTTARD